MSEQKKTGTQAGELRRERAESIIAHIQQYGSSEGNNITAVLFDLFQETLETATGAAGLERFSTVPAGEYDRSNPRQAKILNEEMDRHKRDIRENTPGILLASAIMYAGERIAQAIEGIELPEQYPHD